MSLLGGGNTDLNLKMLYDPCLPEDYGGPIFVHKHSLRGIRQFAHVDESVFQGVLCSCGVHLFKFTLIR